MEKAVAENLGEENFNPAFRQQFHVGAVLFQRRHIRNRNAVYPLHHHHVLATVIGVHLRDIQHGTIFKIAA
ncbi:Uncharacterised protein [Salmonella enterica subsp. enterica serovar Bovismorbificans]|uniref:Uncharacterized protein n=1 Tax=Salmonella enterica subsp. enterica serovar Bovismorbificans TaxID=58097 RepID=A0A655CZE9_SALET|nr:Uncharacterised protein [Salmonella enterica subsp. enterica serovar Bovismorbificans]